MKRVFLSCDLLRGFGACSGRGDRLKRVAQRERHIQIQAAYPFTFRFADLTHLPSEMSLPGYEYQWPGSSRDPGPSVWLSAPCSGAKHHDRSHPASANFERAGHRWRFICRYGRQRRSHPAHRWRLPGAGFSAESHRSPERGRMF